VAQLGPQSGTQSIGAIGQYRVRAVPALVRQLEVVRPIKIVGFKAQGQLIQHRNADVLPHPPRRIDSLENVQYRRTYRQFRNVGGGDGGRGNDIAIDIDVPEDE
jgi:hypothetical protein